MQTRPSPSLNGPTRRERRQAQASGRTSPRQRDAAAARQKRIFGWAAGAIVLLLAVFVAVRLISSGSGSAGASNVPAPADLVAQVTGIDPSIYNQVGRGAVATLPIPVRASLERGPNGLPLVSYIGAEYCPFCAAQRWSVVAALSRFGTFSGLQLSHSATDDVYPNTSTFSFVGSSYTSQFVDFSSVELQSNIRSGNGYAQLQSPTPAQTALLQKFDAPPYVPAQSAGSIPFLDLAGQYVVSGASYDVGVLRSMPHAQIAASLSDPSSPVTQGIVGGANVLSAAICSANGNTPQDVCGEPAVQAIEATLVTAQVPGQ